ncbi:bifunctional 2-polyprenyl-6-hydroxyphenol methylase/3-demethylubiquinol 3-O-methyltransferase UbiG [Pedobacter sp. SYP-B3415]|uniref:class I SAM-dependent methyltransferase n=1 Tax=Pedobacter sp. SYP-B3415 TaxID=2496641 RepID=UPI00101C9927|nr:class I SAM-dependent methyltransferase [Pedobacter sp. SYP-B3415]
MDSSSTSLSHAIYSDPAFVKQYAASIKDNAWNAYYERPASLSLLPPLQGLDVFDAGCGPGLTTRMMLEAGANVTAADYSEQMLQTARETTDGAVTFLIQDLNDPLALPDGGFDVVYCTLVIHYVDDLYLLFNEFWRILRPGGILVFSTDHPGRPGFSEPERKQVTEVEWSSYNIRMKVYERSWKEVEDPCLAAGFHIERMLEPRPDQAAEEADPEAYAYLSQNKHFICVRAVKG